MHPLLNTSILFIVDVQRGFTIMARNSVSGTAA